MIGKIPGIKRSPPLAGEGCFGRSRLYRQFSSHHAFMQSRTDKKLSPNSVRVYSTRGGASQKSWQGTRWALSLPCSKAFRRNAQPAPARSCSKGAWGIPNKQRLGAGGYPKALLANSPALASGLRFLPLPKQKLRYIPNGCIGVYGSRW